MDGFTCDEFSRLWNIYIFIYLYYNIKATMLLVFLNCTVYIFHYTLFLLLIRRSYPGIYDTAIQY